ncbi:MAG: S8 family serine peptidase [Flavobacteriales bacterium]
MKNPFSIALVTLCLLGMLSGFTQEAAYIPGDLLVMLHPGASAATIAADLGTLHGQPTGLSVVREVSAPMRTWLLHFDEEHIAQPVMLRAMKDHPDVLLAQNNHTVKTRVVPDDTEYGQQWHHQNINSETAWDISTGGVTATGDTIVVCIVENADLPHPDLIANAWFNHAEIPGNTVDDDGNGYVDDYRGWNTPNGNDAVYGGGHGTQVAGMVGAVGNNALGVAGANWAVKMMAVDYGGTQEAQVVAAYTYPLVMRRRYNDSNGAQGAFVVATNASWGIDGGDPADAPIWCAMYDTLGTEGVLNCGSTTNQNWDVDIDGDLPTACASDFMVSVTATNNMDVRTFSGYGATTVDVGAPGESVRTTSLGGGYNNASGTSFASPLTAGVIGLLYSAPCASLMGLVHADPAAGALYVRDKLFEGVDQVGNLPGQTVTGGRINAGTSMQLIMNGCASCPAPYNLGAFNNEMAMTTLTWSAFGGSTFDLRYRAVGAVDWIDMNGLVAPEFLLTGLDVCTAYEFQVRVYCIGETSAYSEAFTWTSEGCCTTPTGLTAGFIGEDLANVFWTDVLAADSFEVQYRPVTGGAWNTITGITGAFTEIPGLTPCTTYEVQVRTVCDGPATEWSSSISFHTLGCGACVDNTFCPSEGSDTSDEFIDRVHLGAIDNTSGNNGGYGDFTDLSTDITIGLPTALTLTPGYGAFTFNEYFTVWMDLDHDGQFATPAERVFDPGTTTTTALSGNLTVPLGAIVGPTRMRVIMQYDAAVANGCVSFTYGETEDYCVNLLEYVGMAEAGQNAVVRVYPSPADDALFIDLDGAFAGRTLMLVAYDYSGRAVTHTPLLSDRATVDTADLANGLYHYRITDGDRTVANGRFVVAH